MGVTGVARSSVALRAGRTPIASHFIAWAWNAVAGIGNACAFAAVVFCMGTSYGLLEGTSRAIVPVSSLLLLLPHTWPLTLLHAGNRYAPLVTATAVVLSVSALANVAARIGTAGSPWIVLRGLALCSVHCPRLPSAANFSGTCGRFRDAHLCGATAGKCADAIITIGPSMIWARGGPCACLHLVLARRARELG